MYEHDITSIKPSCQIRFEQNTDMTKRYYGLSPNELMKLILSQVLSFVVYGLAVGIIIGVAFTKLLALVDSGSEIIFDVKILLAVSVLFLFVIRVVFSVQGYWISRKKLADELVE